MPFNFKDLVGFDANKIDKMALRKWLVQGATLLEPAIITPGNIDKMLFDNLDAMIAKLIDQISNEGGTLIVGDVEVSQGELSTYMSQFANVPQESQAILRGNPKLVRRLQKFSKEEQEKIVGNPLLLMALQVLLPILFKFLLNRFTD